MKNEKLKSWLSANDLNPSGSLPAYLLFSHKARAIILSYILSHSNNNFFKEIARIILRSHYHIEIRCKSIGYRLRMPHPRNIIIGAESIGDDVQINQNVTLGKNMRKSIIRDGREQIRPIIGNSVVIHANAVVAGPCRIGDNVIIGANCTCTHDVESNMLLYNKVGISQRKIKVNAGTYEYLP